MKNCEELSGGGVVHIGANCADMFMQPVLLREVVVVFGFSWLVGR